MASDTATEQPQQNSEPVKEEVETKEEAKTATEAEAPAKEDGKEAKEEKPEKEEKKKKEKPAKKEKEPKEPAPPKPTVHKVDYQEGVVYLYQFTRTPVIPSCSPFCLKVETWLRINQIKYENVDHKMSLRSKKGMLPFVELNGEEIADSTHIIEELSKRFTKNLDASLTPEQRCISHTTISMIENELFWVLYWWRSKHPDKFLKGIKLNVKQALGSKLPNGLLNFIFKLKFRSGQSKVKAQGLGVHTAEEIEEKGRKDLQVLSEMLADKDFFFGAEPTLLDVVAYSVVSQFVCFDPEVEFPLRSWMEQNTANLITYVNRIKEKYYPDWDEMLKNLDLNSHLPKPEPKEAEKEPEEKEKEKEKKDKKEEKKEDAPAKTEEAKEEAKPNGDAEEKKE
jgi:glutathione S-transferase